MPYDFDTSKIPFHDVKTGAGSFPGCPIDRLQVPDVISESRLFAISQRPKLPPVVVKPADATQVKKVDLAKEDLGFILNRNDWQSGAVFEASGSGLRFMSPAKISGKSLRIVFRQGDGPPLKLEPKVPDQKAKPDHVGLFNIENGMLDIQSGFLEAVQTLKGAALTPWLINAKKRQCHHQGLSAQRATAAGSGTAPGPDSVDDDGDDIAPRAIGPAFSFRQ